MIAPLTKPLLKYWMAAPCETCGSFPAFENGRLRPAGRLGPALCRRSLYCASTATSPRHESPGVIERRRRKNRRERRRGGQHRTARFTCREDQVFVEVMYLVYRAAGGTDEDEALFVSRLAPGGDIRH